MEIRAAGGRVGGPYLFNVPASSPAPSGGLRLWLLASEGPSALSEANRRLFLDRELGTSALAPGDVVLQRMGCDRYQLLATADLPAVVHDSLIEAVRALLGKADLKADRVTGVRELLAISFRPGPARSVLVGSTDDLRERTAFEQALLQIADRRTGERLVEALSAFHRSAPAIEGDVHPAVRAIFQHARGDMLLRLFEATEREEFAQAARPAYACAADAFSRVGLRNLTRRFGTHRTMSEQPLPGFELAPRPRPAALGYSVQRLCGFAVGLSAPDIWLSSSAGEGAYAVIADLDLSDRAALHLVAGESSPHRRLVATIQQDHRGVTIEAGLQDELRAFLGAAPSSLQDGVNFISIRCKTIDFETDVVAVRPREAVVFRGRPLKSRHKVEIHLSAGGEDDLALRFQLSDEGASPRVILQGRP